MTFIHQFSRGVRCTVTTTNEPPPKGNTSFLTFEWSSRPKKKHLIDYKRWLLEVCRICADKWEKRILYAVQISPKVCEYWLFAPGETPVRVDEKKAEEAA